jgi:hypothetical protein
VSSGDDDQGWLAETKRAAARLVAEQAANQATRAVTDVAKGAARQAQDAAMRALDDAERWIGAEAATAEARRAASGLPDTTAPDPAWNTDKGEDVPSTESSASPAPIGPPAPTAAERLARAREELARLKAAVNPPNFESPGVATATGLPAPADTEAEVDPAELALAKARAARGAAGVPEPDMAGGRAAPPVEPEVDPAELALAKALAARGVARGTPVTSQEAELDPAEAALARAAEARKRSGAPEVRRAEVAREAARARIAAMEAEVAEHPSRTTPEVSPSAPALPEHPLDRAEAALARARAALGVAGRPTDPWAGARQEARDRVAALQQAAEAVADAPFGQAPDPVQAALAAAQAARQAAGLPEPVRGPDREAILAKARLAAAKTRTLLTDPLADPAPAEDPPAGPTDPVPRRRL